MDKDGSGHSGVGGHASGPPTPPVGPADGASSMALHHASSSLSSELNAVKSAGSKLQQFSSKFKLVRRNKPAGSPEVSASPPSAPKVVGQGVRKMSEELAAVRSASALGPDAINPSELSGGFSIRKGSTGSTLGIEEFNPKASHPSNPLAPIAPLLTSLMKPITVPSKALMARTFKGRYPLPDAPSPLPPSKFDGTPPMGYLWLWMGGFMRWRRRFLVASEAPGVVLIYKRMNMKGKVWSISLRNATIHPDDADPRQLKILTPSGLIFLRAVDSIERDKWLHCLSQSISMYHEKQRLVEGLQQQGLLPPLGLGAKSRTTPRGGRLAPMLEGGAHGAVGAVGGMNEVSVGLDTVGLQLLPTGDVADIDVEQRRRIRTRVGEKLSEIAPYQVEVEQHMNQLSTQLLGVVSALNIRVGNLTPATSNVRLAHFLANTQAAAPHSFTRTSGPVPGTSPQGGSPHKGSSPDHSDSGGPAKGEALPPQLPATVSEGAMPATAIGAGGQNGAAADAVPTSATGGGVAPLAGGAVKLGAAPAVVDEGPGPAAAPAPLPPVAPSVAPPMRSMPSTTLRAANRLPTSRPANLQQAYGNMLEAFRCILHGEAVRIAQLEAENQALHRTLQVMKASEARRLKATRSNAGAAIAPAAPASGALPRLSPTASRGGRAVTLDDAPDALAHHPGTQPGVAATHALGPPCSGRSPSASLMRAASDVSLALTADEDAFDVLEAFDDSVDYGILDEPGYATLQEGTPGDRGAAVARRRIAQVLAEEGGGTTTEVEECDEDEEALCPEGAEEEEEEVDEEGAEADMEVEEEARKEAEVLQALEVVRQVHYVEQAHSAARLTAMLASSAPPPPQAGMPEDTGPTSGDDEEEEESDDEVEDSADAMVQDLVAGGARAGGDARQAPIGRVSLPVHRRRSRLPAAKPLGRGFSVWSVLKDMIGKDLTRITMPATINEPLTFLQRLAESFEYARLLERAAHTPNSTTRMMLVAVWQLSCYNSQPLREGKPFNPLLGETYEWQSTDGSIKFLCEQVSHHPPVSAYHARGPSWEVQGEFEVKTKFWGKSIELLMMGCEALRLPGYENEEYRWNKATICVNDLIFGNFYADIYGKVKISNSATGDAAVLNLKPCKGRREKRGEFEGSVFDASGREMYKLYGSTLDKVYAALTPAGVAALGGSTEPVLMWQKDPYPEDYEVQYNFTRFAIELNDPSDHIAPHLPPTDARFRPDQRALETGEFGRATTEKLRLEEKQRQARRALAEAGKQYRPMWFVQKGGSAHHAPVAGRKTAAHGPLTKNADEEGFVWSFTNEYWQRREARDWSGCPDLYS